MRGDCTSCRSTWRRHWDILLGWSVHSPCFGLEPSGLGGTTTNRTICSSASTRRSTWLSSMHSIRITSAGPRGRCIWTVSSTSVTSTPTRTTVAGWRTTLGCTSFPSFVCGYLPVQGYGGCPFQQLQLLRSGAAAQPLHGIVPPQGVFDRAAVGHEEARRLLRDGEARVPLALDGGCALLEKPPIECGCQFFSAPTDGLRLRRAGDVMRSRARPVCTWSFI
mmetsp:Transcript_165423/g.525746  ORF Transcript_165423/g.525746 Transcript_165423/m.525746 type:complete len:221 (+) Transcript_165423:1288-1950(+)